MPSFERALSDKELPSYLKRYNELYPSLLSEKIAYESKEFAKLHKQLDSLVHDLCYIRSESDWINYQYKIYFPNPDPKPYLEEELKKLQKPVRRKITAIPEKPDEKSKKYFIDRAIKSLFSFGSPKKQFEFDDSKYQKDIRAWEKRCRQVESFNKGWEDNYEKKLKAYNKAVKILKNKYDVEKWKTDKEEHDRIYESIYEGYSERSDVIPFIIMILNSSKYPIDFNREISVDFDPENKIGIIDYLMPSIASVPSISSLTYLPKKNAIKEQLFTEKEMHVKYDKMLYDITLRSIMEIFMSDYKKIIHSLVYNGWVEIIEKSSGKKQKVCILSIQVKRQDIEGVDVNHVDPKAWYRKNKGIGGISLKDYVPIRPIIILNKEDKRFVASYSVEVNDAINLAAMDWEDFEHLVRDIFEKEFSSQGGEVKVTRASRDGGVDAVAFNPDPILGGKIIIQAKRYTITVGVAAVRDLYGTVINEGANRGILVTTSDYGPDAYEFAKDKPITLLNGANLLHLLQKHGQSARIDIEEARRLLYKPEK